MVLVDLNKIKWCYQDKVITVSEKDVPFSTEYNVLSPKGGNKIFKFTHSTGPEFDADTKWMYKSEDGLQLAVCNNAKMVQKAVQDYLKAKLQNHG